jgi:hypothetical protein
MQSAPYSVRHDSCKSPSVSIPQQNIEWVRGGCGETILRALRTNVVTLYEGVENIVLVDRKLVVILVRSVVYFPYTLVALLFEALSNLGKGMS